ncbi:MAG: ATPase domain-containing protein [Candidatus Thorarchaeota archaeon]
MSSKDRCSTGIDELDKLLIGGIPKGRTILVEGPPGTGKTILSLHFILAGTIYRPRDPEPCIFVCLDSSPADLIREAATFGWNLQRLIELKQLIIIDAFSGRLGLKPELPLAITAGEFSIKKVMQRIEEAYEEISPKRLVIDPVSALLDDLDERKRREAVLGLTALLSRLSLTTLLNAEVKEAGVGVERYAAHGLIRLDYEEVGSKVGRTLRIVKMRETMHAMDIVPYEIKANGIELKI